MSVLGTRKQPWSTPCVGVCTATALGDPICKGCGRTAEEVRDWNKYPPERKQAINERLHSNVILPNKETQNGN